MREREYALVQELIKASTVHSRLNDDLAYASALAVVYCNL